MVFTYFLYIHMIFSLAILQTALNPVIEFGVAGYTSQYTSSHTHPQPTEQLLLRYVLRNGTAVSDSLTMS